jgi:uncharacterized damage-inducible protein DinB
VDTDDIRTLYDFNAWANLRVVAMTRCLNLQEFAKDLGTSYRSVQGTLVHILWGEWLWLQRWRGDSPKQIFAPEDFPDVAAIETRWRTVEREQRQFVERLTNEVLKQRLAYENFRGQRWEYSLGHMMQHTANHSSYHRGQVVTLLRQLGKTPEATDFLVFLDETARLTADRR